MRLQIQQRRDGQTEIVAAGQSFLVRTDQPEVEIPKTLLQELLLSELPDQIGVKPLGVKLTTTAGANIDCWLYGFRDGYASARIKVAERRGTSPRLRALREAACKRQDERGDVETEELYEVDGNSTFSFLVDLMDDVLVERALEHVDQVVRELEEQGKAGLAGTEPKSSSLAKRAATKNL
jgi:hypothetical protein